MNLFFVPHAGGSARSYLTFKPYIDRSIKICPLEIAGRGSRMNETRFRDYNECVVDLFNRNKEAFEAEDYAIFGHSMGSVLTYELVKLIEKNNIRKPKHVFFSGRTAPSSRVSITFKEESELTDEVVLSFMKQCDDLPDILLQNKDLLDMSIAILRDDIIMINPYVYTNDPVVPISSDITVTYGKQDVFDFSDMASWSKFTSKNCNIIGMDGNHFYYREHLKEMGEIINTALLNN